MMLRTHLAKSAAAVVLLALFASGGAQESSRLPDASSVERRSPWLDRPWELRYFLYVTPSWDVVERAATRRQATRDPAALDRLWEEVFSSTHFFQSRSRWAEPGEGVSVVLIEFERDGTVRTPHKFGLPLRGRLDRLMYVTLAAGGHATEPRFDLGKWFLGVGDASTHWAPGLCGINEMPSPFSRIDTRYLYGPRFELSPSHPTFGCREWAYQLYEPSRPYIDITSYVPKNKDPDGPGTYIHEVIGWAGFDDRKAIIGQHESAWYCLHDCPGGDKPGPIPDIKHWAARHGWRVPKPPTRIPTFPDPPAKAGTYP